MLYWDWQFKDPRRRGHFRTLDITVKAISRVKAQFRLVSHVKNGIRKEKRAVPEREGT